MAESEMKTAEELLTGIQAALADVHLILKSHGEMLTGIQELLDKAAPLLDSRAARFALGGGGSVLDHLKRSKA